MPLFAKNLRKQEVKGITARVMQVAMLGGDCHPATPIGINLPNAEWIRERYGSKSVTLDNITYAYDMAAKSSGMIDEFAGSDEEIRLAREWGTIGSNVHTDLHECLGHGSGKMLPGVTTEALRNYYSTIERSPGGFVRPLLYHGSQIGRTGELSLRWKWLKRNTTAISGTVYWYNSPALNSETGLRNPHA